MIWLTTLKFLKIRIVHALLISAKTIFDVNLLPLMRFILCPMPIRVLYKTQISYDLMYHANNKPDPKAHQPQSWWLGQIRIFDKHQAFVVEIKCEIIGKRDHYQVVSDEVYQHCSVLLAKRLDATLERLLDKIHAHYDDCKTYCFFHHPFYCLILSEN